MHSKTIAELAEGLKKGDFSSEELTKNFLQRINQYDSELNSFITVSEEHALAQARAADEAIAKGQTSVLAGIPLGQKDIFCTNGIKTTCGSKCWITLLHRMMRQSSINLTRPVASW